MTDAAPAYDARPAKPRARATVAGRHATPAMVWRVCIALIFAIVLMRMIGAFPLPNDTQVVRLSLTQVADNAARISQVASAQVPVLPSPEALLAINPDAARVSNAAVAVQPSSDSAPPFRSAGMPTDAIERAADCLAAAEWYEAGDNPPGERAVAQVVLNRVRHPAFAKSVCGVVFQGAQDGAHGNGACQFTFACDGSMVARTPGPPAWTRARAIALAALAGAVDSDVGLATHYHADYVVPRWRDSLVKLGVVGPHLFYRWPGYWGSPGALRPLPWGNDEPRVPSLARLSPAHGIALPEDDGVTLSRGAAPANIPSTMAAARSLGEVVAPVSRTGGTTERIAMMVDPAAFSGSYAVRAFGLCKDHPRCLVIGRNPAAPDAIAFLLLHDTRKGAETALWNCARTPRPDTAQCLPDGAATARMVANWAAY
ncbi:cell wall hydrolase [Novosphingobium sp.]|uniref:cell wall hydrolase n=1 Tax=Novosphingobium sp. TaxID=1874826 RepID=UPI003D10F402